VEWLRLAIEHLRAAGALTGRTLKWEVMREESLRYLQSKKKQGWW